MSENIPVVGILTDFGTRGQHYVAQLKAIFSSICPNVVFNDISHTIKPFSIIEGAYILVSSYSYYPKGTIFVCIVDPNAGTEEDIIVIESRDGYKFIGPDNGIFSYLALNNLVSVVVKATDIDFYYEPFKESLLQQQKQQDYQLEIESVMTSAITQPPGEDFSFDSDPKMNMSNIKEESINSQSLITHSNVRWRDIITPVAAHICNGLDIYALGEVSDNMNILDELSPDVNIEKKKINARIQYVDSFGNLITTINNFAFQSLSYIQNHQIILIFKDIQQVLHFDKKFTGYSKDTLLFIPGDGGFMEIVMNQNNAQNYLKMNTGDVFEISVEEIE